MGKHRHVPVEIRYAAILFLKRQFAGDVGHAGRKHRQMKLGHGTVSPEEGKKKTKLPSPSHHPRILSIRPRTARRHPAFLVGRIDLANNFAITPLQSHPSEIRRSEGAKAAIHMVSAFAARQRLVLGQVKVADKSNEIIAIPALLDMLVIEGAIITTDAIGCQRDIAQKVLDKNADYILALKGNQGTLREDVELFAAEQKANGFSDTKITRHKTVDGDHGRIETRTYTVIHDVAWLQERHQWPGLQGVAMVESERQ